MNNLSETNKAERARGDGCDAGSTSRPSFASRSTRTQHGVDDICHASNKQINKLELREDLKQSLLKGTRASSLLISGTVTGRVYFNKLVSLSSEIPPH